ncbi:hypothetical protein LSH36_292g01000, partial [Paralvinella palmiformis]
QVLSPTYKSRSEDFKRIFKDIPSDERLIVDYSCALQKDILIHGRLYITQNSICFYANIFRWETIVSYRRILSTTFRRISMSIYQLELANSDIVICILFGDGQVMDK